MGFRVYADDYYCYDAKFLVTVITNINDVTTVCTFTITSISIIRMKLREFFQVRGLAQAKYSTKLASPQS